MSNVQTKYTQQIVDQFRHELLKRRNHCYEVLDSLDDLQYTTIDLINEEISRIDKIFKLIKNDKI